MNETIELLSRILDCTTLRHQTLANNVANANTPRYRRMDVEFKNALAAAMDSEDKLRGFQPKVMVDTEAPVKGDGNSVSLQHEMGEMAENALLYQFAAKAVDNKFEGLKKAIKGR